MKTKRLYIITLISILFLVSCAIQPEELPEEIQHRTLVLWTHDFPTYTAAFQEKWIPEFEAANPGVTVEYKIIPYSGGIISFDSKLLAEVSSGGGPDVWAMASHNFTQAEYMNADLLAPLDPKIFGYNSVSDIINDYPENSLEVFVKDGKLYGLLNELTTLCLFYNQSMFDEAGLEYLSETQPTSWNTLGQYSKTMLKVDESSGIPQQMGYQFGFFANYPSPEWYSQNFYPILRQQGQDDVLIDGKPAGNSKAMIDAFQVFYDFSHTYQAYDPYFAQDWFSGFANNQVAMVTAGPWFASAIESINPDVRFGVAPHPVVDPKNPASYENIMYSFGWVVNASSSPEQQQLAQEFLAFILGKKQDWEQPLWWFENVGVIQPRTAFLNSQEYQRILEKDPWMDCFFETFNTYTVDYYQHSSDEAGAALVRAINRVIYNKMPPEESAEILQNELLLLP